MQKTYTVEEVAIYCKCHKETIKDYIRKGLLPAVKIGRRWVICQKDLDLFMETLKNDHLQKMQAERSKQCRSTCETVFGRLTSSTTVKELDDLLKRPVKQKPKSYMIK